MSKNTASNAFRKIDVDAFNEDNFKDDDGGVQVGGGVGGGGGSGGVGEAQIGAWIQEGKNVEALKAVLSQAPIGNKNQQEKVNIHIDMTLWQHYGCLHLCRHLTHMHAASFHTDSQFMILFRA
jgi:hypothetical protein